MNPISSIFLCVVALSLLVAWVQSAKDSNCIVSRDTNTCTYFTAGQTFAQFYCDAETEKCTEKETAVLGEGAGDNTLCTESTTRGLNSYNYDRRCRIFMPRECSIRNGNEESCTSKSTIVAGRCAKTQAPDYQSANQMCGSNDGEGNARNCGPNLICNSKRVCERRSPLGGSCSGSYRGCVTGATCEHGTCIAPYSMPYNSPCESNSACASGYCDPDTKRCSHSLVTTKCLRNFECQDSNQFSACINSNGVDSPGTCTTNFYAQYSAYYNCVAEKCTAAYGESDYEPVEECGPKQCNREFARLQCANACGKSEDKRFNSEIEYTINCEDFTATPWSEMDTTERCNGVDKQIIGCSADVLTSLAGSTA